MSQRRDMRVPSDRPVRITIFGEPDLHLSAIVKNASGRGLGLELETQLPVGAALKIMLDDAILLGEVIYCRKQNTTWYAGVELEQALFGLAELASALSSFSEPASSPEQPHTTKHAGHQHE